MPSLPLKPARSGLLFLLLALLPATHADTPPAAPVLRDGAHDFDFAFGTWHTHIHRILDPFSASSETIDLEGTVTARRVWGGRASLEEIEADGPKGHWEGLGLFLYDPQARQWNQYFVNSKMGVLNAPLVGEFHEGRGELYSGDTFKDRAILVRAVWSDITPDSHRYEEYFSEDGGKTWALSFSAKKTRVKS
jgi:hypothetical protein